MPSDNRGVKVKITKSGVGIILLIAIAVALAGCSGANQPATTTGMPSGGSSPQPGSVVSGAASFQTRRSTGMSTRSPQKREARR